MSRLKYTKEILENAVKSNISMMGTMRTLGASLTSGALRTYLIGRIKYFGIDNSHFLGQAWNQGKNHVGGPAKKTAIQILIIQKEGPRERSKILKRALLEIGVEYKCSICKLSEWRNGPIRLEVEHKNGKPLDNRLENLCFLCPNCHSQTENYCKMPQ